MARPIRWIQQKIELAASYISSWNRNRKFGIDKYFTVDNSISDPESGLFPVRLLRGPYAGTLYSYGLVHIVGGANSPGLKYKVNILDGPQDNSKDPSFMEITAEVLLVLMQEAYMKNGGADLLERENFDYEEDRDDYLEEPVQQRTVRSQSPTVSEGRVPNRKPRKDSFRRN